MAYLVALVLGVVLGAIAGYTWGITRLDLSTARWESQKAEMLTEIERVRAQVARLIGSS